MSAPAPLRAVPEIVQALAARLTALEWEGQPAFHAVLRHDLADLDRALAATNERGPRLALLIPDDEVFTPRLSGRAVLVTRRLPVALILCDQVLGDRGAALWGAPPQNPGAFGLAKIVLPIVTGRLLDAPAPVTCHPTRCGVLALGDTAREGRAAVELDLECAGGSLSFAASPTSGPIL